MCLFLRSRNWIYFSLYIKKTKSCLFSLASPSIDVDQNKIFCKNIKQYFFQCLIQIFMMFNEYSPITPGALSATQDHPLTFTASERNTIQALRQAPILPRQTKTTVLKGRKSSYIFISYFLLMECQQRLRLTKESKRWSSWEVLWASTKR